MAGYIDPDTKKIVCPDKGTPQGSVLSPLLANIVLHELDWFMQNELQPIYTQGRYRRRNSSHRKTSYQLGLIKKRRTDYADQSAFQKALSKAASNLRQLNYYDLTDNTFKRFVYVRYADDWIVLLIGSKSDALKIKEKTAQFCKTLGLTLSDTKTKVTHLMYDKAKYLGFYITRYSTIGKRKWSVPTSLLKMNGTLVKSRITPRLVLLAPIEELLKKLKEAKFIKRNSLGSWFPISKTNMIMMPHWYILNYYNSKMRGIYNYYLPANNIYKLASIFWLLRASCAITLARKFKLGQRTISAAMSKFGKSLSCVVNGKTLSFWSPPNYKRIPVGNRFNIKTNLDITALITKSWVRSSTLPQFDEKCVICGSTNIEIHHVRSVKDIRAKYISKDNPKIGISYQQWVGSYLRKSIPLCKHHHMDLHAHRLTLDQLNKIAAYKGKLLHTKVK
jgi:hypothetical protein